MSENEKVTRIDSAEARVKSLEDITREFNDSCHKKITALRDQVKHGL
jgi:hypothetical protein